MVNKKKQNLAGFTLVELLIVIVIIAILAAITIVAYRGMANNAKVAALKSNLAQMSSKLEVYKVDKTAYPDDLASAGLTNTGQDGTIYNYQPSSTTYCLSATKDTISYRVTNSNTAPTEGTCSGVLGDGSTCPTGFIAVPGSAVLGTNDFCVMKYEAKIQGNNDGNQTYSTAFVPESRASGTPWVNISQTNALSESSTVSGCPTCHLISEAEWMTIAANVLSVPSNWSGGSVGSGYIYQGHINNNPASGLDAPTDDSDGQNGMTGGLGAAGANNRRTLTLTNGEVIWDFSGNVWEWTQGTIAGGAQPGLSGESAYAWKQWNNPSLLMNGLPFNSQPAKLASLPGLSGITGWSSTQGIGQLYSNYGETGPRPFLRGGHWNSTSYAGVLALNLNNAPAFAGTSFGFRVSR